MPVDPEKLRKSYIKKARNILRLTPEKQQKAKKKLKQRLEEKKAHVTKLEKEVKMYKDHDSEALVAYSKALQKKAREEGRDEKISDFRVPVSREEFIEKEYANLPPDQRPPILRQDWDQEKWWNNQIRALEDKQVYEQADRDSLFEDNKTLSELQIDDLEGQRAIIEPLKFENMVEHFGGKLVHKLADIEVKEINKKTKNEKKRKELHNTKLTDKNKARFTEIRDNELYKIDYGLKELQANYKKLTGKKYAPKIG